MSRSVLTTLLLVAAVLGGALLIYRGMFAEPEQVAQVEPPVVDTPAPPKDAGYTPPDAGAPAPLKATVVSSRGLVEVKAADGTWQPAKVGQELGAEEAVRTGRNGEANLRFGDGIEVRVSPLSEFSVRDLEADLSRIRLEEGHVAASVDPAKQRALQVEAQGSDAVAESKGGDFGVVTDGRGQLTVATQTGSVKLSSRGKTVEVAAGETSTVLADGDGPTAPRAIPKSLFIKLQEPAARRINQRHTVVEGQTAPGSIVRVDGKLAKTDSKGRFRVKAKLKDGKNRVSVNVLDASGRKQTAKTSEIVVDREKPQIESEMQWGGGGTSGGR
jgi:hypothetical protein